MPGSRVSIKTGPRRQRSRHEPLRSSSSSGRSRRRCIMLGIVVFGADGLPAAAGQRPADRRLPHHPGAAPACRARARRRWRRRSRCRSRSSSRRSPASTSINSTSSQGSTNITLQFDLSRNIDAAAQDVQAMIARAARAAAAADAGAAVVSEGQSRRPAGHASWCCARRRCRCRRSTSTRRRRSRSASRWSAASRRCRCSARRSTRCASTSIRAQLAARGIGIDEVASADPERQRQPADRHDVRRRSRPSRCMANGQLLQRRGLRADDRRLPQRQPGAARRGRARLRRRRERQDARPGTAASARSTSRSRSSRAPTSSRSSTRSRRCCRRSASSCRRR